MPLYLVLETSTNKRFRQSLIEDEVLPLNKDGSEYLHVLQSRDTEPDESIEPYDVVARDFVPPPVVIEPPVTTLTVLEFKARFTQEERDLMEIAQDEHPDRLARARLRQLEKDLESAQNKIVDRADPRIQMGVYMLTQIVFEGQPLVADIARAQEIIGADALGG